MTALQAYLQNSRTRKLLNKKPGEAGFSLIELVVVVAVLAVLAAIAIPAYNNITEKGRTSAAKTALANAVKECAVSKADTSNPLHSALVDGSGLSYTTGLKGTACTEVTAGVCVLNATKEYYAVNLATQVKTTGNFSNTPAATGCAAGPGVAW